MLEALGHDPRLPAAWQGVELKLRYHGRRLRLRAGHDRLELATDDPVPVRLPGRRGGPSPARCQLAAVRPGLEGGAEMSTILATIDATAAARPVLHTAVLGRRLRLPVVALQVRQDGVEPERLLAARAAAEPRLAVGVLAWATVGALGGTDAMAMLGVRGHPAGPRPAGSTALAVANYPSKPVVVVPPEPHDPPPAGLHRVLVPLDGTPDAARPWSGPCAGSPARASRS